MKYSMRRRAGGREFRYNYGTGNLECVVKYHGAWTPMSWISVDRSDWKNRHTRKAIMQEFCETIKDREFGARYNIRLAR